MPISSKRSIILMVLSILKEHSDTEHRLLQTDILNLLKDEYDLQITRKTLGQHLTDLMALGYPLEYDKGWFYEGAFCEAELNLLYDSVLFNDYLPEQPRRDLLKKIREMGSVYYKPAACLKGVRNANPQFLFSLEMIQSAIDAHQQVRFQYAQYDVDKKLHPKLDEHGCPYLYIFNPYRVVMANGRYYVIGNVDKYDNVSHFRLDKILECTPLEAPVKPQKDVIGLEAGLRIPEYMAGHAYMFSGKTVPVRLHIKRAIVGDVLDWFGMEVRFEKITDETAEAVFSTDEGSLTYWLKQYDAFAQRIDS